jgi:DNA-binding GntR family transcriptional regulator
VKAKSNQVARRTSSPKSAAASPRKMENFGKRKAKTRAVGMSLLNANANAPSMADRAYAYLTEKLSNGELRGGDVIQESRLAEKLKLSRTPIRDALGRLEGEGLLTRSGRTLAVRRVTVKEFLDMLHVRRLIEPEAAFLAAGKLDISLLADLKERLLSVTDDQNSAELIALDESIHLSIVGALRNDCLADLVRNLRRRTRLFELTELPGKKNSGRPEDLKLIDALIMNNAQRAKMAMLEHLDTLRDEIVERIRSL